MTFDPVMMVTAGALSLLPPFVFVVLRNAVKTKRRLMVIQLGEVLKIDPQGRESSIPSFEFVKYKYLSDARTGSGNRGKPRDHSLLSWSVGALPLVLLLFAVSYLVVTFIGPFVLEPILGGWPDIRAASVEFKRESAWIWSLCSAFAGGYTFMIRSFYRAINNFDLSPLSFAGACNNLFVGIAGAEILSLAILEPVLGLAKSDIPLVSAIVFSSFAIGYFPEAATRAILWRGELIKFKKENGEVYKSSLTTPVEIIDGIDTDIRDRLADYHIRSTQNLAAANPLMLFVETPFGVYQIMDWVAQAQLCSSVGPESLTKLWKLGIRTLFDLEKIACDPNCTDPILLKLVGGVLLDGTVNRQAADPSKPDLPGSAEMKKSVVANILGSEPIQGIVIVLVL